MGLANKSSTSYKKKAIVEQTVAFFFTFVSIHRRDRLPQSIAHDIDSSED
jgi:hypothetical protein